MPGFVFVRASWLFSKTTVVLILRSFVNFYACCYNWQPSAACIVSVNYYQANYTLLVKFSLSFFFVIFFMSYLPNRLNILILYVLKTNPILYIPIYSYPSRRDGSKRLFNYSTYWFYLKTYCLHFSLVVSMKNYLSVHVNTFNILLRILLVRVSAA